MTSNLGDTFCPRDVCWLGIRKTVLWYFSQKGAFMTPHYKTPIRLF